MRRTIPVFALLCVASFCLLTLAKAQTPEETLADFFDQWRYFENPGMINGAPDYRKQTFENRMPQFKRLQEKLLGIDTMGWTVADRVDWTIIWAEMNGFDFNHRILKPWVRDPAFYKTVWTYRSDVPAHEGPTHHATTELWTYGFPLSDAEERRLITDLSVIPPLNEQAKENLTGNARDLWVAGIRDIKTQSRVLSELKSAEGVSKSKKLTKTIDAAIAATDDLATWLEEQAPSKTGPSGIGKENYSWYMQNVHLVPLSWDDEVMILKRELAMAWSSLKLEEHRNRKLPKFRTPDLFAN